MTSDLDSNPPMDAALAALRAADDGQRTTWEADDQHDAGGHHWSQSELDALLLAVAAARPLLVRGEAGCGKSQIALAASKLVPNAKYFREVIHGRFEARDLLYRFDVVGRLADSQGGRDDIDPTNERYIKRGGLWRAFASESALPVLLIDEIDKADASVPNSILDVLGDRSFDVAEQPERDPVRPTRKGSFPLIIITTNEERALPGAFVRRCVVLDVGPPESEDPFVHWLCERSSAHAQLPVSREVQEESARQVWKDRVACRGAGVPTVGLAEHLDLLRAVHTLTLGAESVAKRDKDQRDWLKRLGQYVLRKHPGMAQSRLERTPGSRATDQPLGNR